MLTASGKFFKKDVHIMRRLKVKRREQRERLERRLRCTNGGKDFAQLDTFHRAIRPYLCVAQLFGMMPLANVLSSDPHALQFRIRSTGMFFAALFLLIGSWKTLNLAMQLFAAGLNAKNMVSLVFFTSNMIIFLNFMSFARRWPRLIVTWSSVDIIMLFPPYEPTPRTLRLKLKIFGCCLCSLALFEHSLYYASGYHSYHMQMMHCQPNMTHVKFDNYVKKEFSDVFQVVPYNIFFAFGAFFLSATFTVIWNFMDLFIMLISLGLAQRFQQFGARVSALAGVHVSDSLWYAIRQDHIRLCELMELIDTDLSNIILVSCLNNIYFICNQLLNIFTKLRYPINYIYFWYSLIYLLGRTSSVFLCASKIHDASLIPFKTVHMVPSDAWSEEAQRFLHQLSNEYIGLSGHRLYYLTRRSLFAMMATLVTYEFMLLQFDAKNRKMGLPDLCA